jgi:hypothetical protein
MSNTYTDSITAINVKPALNSTSISLKPAVAGNIIIKPTISGTVTNEPYVGLYALLTEDGIEILFEDLSAMNTENL